jgi:hypothetical protein
MRTALCFHGISTGTNKQQNGSISVSFKECVPYFLDNIVNPNDNVDIFVHTWGDESKEDIENMYNPVKSKYQESIYPNFKHPYAHFDYEPNVQKKIQSVYSRWYSFKEVIDLKKQHEKENNFTYDCVMVCRFDMVFYKPIIFSDLDLDKFYVSNWHYNWTKNKKFFGYPECWLFSNTENINKYATMYDRLDEYMVDGGEYEKFIVNEVGEPLHTKVSSHALTRWHLYKCGLIKKERFLGLEYETWSLLRKISSRTNPHKKLFDTIYKDCDTPLDVSNHPRSQINVE